MRTVTATFADGTTVQYQNVPYDATPEEVLARLANEFPGKAVRELDGGNQDPESRAKAGNAAAMRAATPATPKKENPVLDPESARHLQKAETFMRTGPKEGEQQFSLPYEREQELRRQLAELDPQRVAAKEKWHRTGSELDRQHFNDLQAKVDAIKKQLPTDWTAVGDFVGNVGGGAAGAAAGGATPVPGGAFVGGVAGATGGGYAGRAAGAMYAAHQRGYNARESEELLKEATGADRIALDLAGNILFMGGGAVLWRWGANSWLGKAIVKKLGLKPERVMPNAKNLTPGEKVFSDTTPGQVRAAAETAEDELARNAKVLTPGQVGPEPGTGEQIARRMAPKVFRRAEEEQVRYIDEQLSQHAKSVAGRQGSETPGHALEGALNDAEQRVKAVTAEAFRKLKALDADKDKIVDISAMRTEAASILEKAPPGALGADELRLLKNIVANEDVITPSAAHDLQSAWQSAARDLEKSGQPNTRMSERLNAAASKMRARLAQALDDAANKVDEQMAMFRTGEEVPGQLVAAEAETVAARQAREAAVARGERPVDIFKQQEEMFGPEKQGELFTTSTGGVAEQSAIKANAARQAEMAAAQARGEAAAESAVRGLPEQQKSMFKEAPTVDPRLPGQLREARDLYREMNENVYSTTGAKALRAAETRGPEHVASMIFAKGNTTAIKEIEDMARFAEKVDKAAASPEAKRALLERAKKLGLNVSDRPVADVVREAQRGIRAEFLRTYANSAEQLSKLPQAMRDPKIQRTFETLFPAGDPSRLFLERMSQAAQMVARGKEQAGQVLGATHVVFSGSAGAATAAGLPAPGLLSLVFGATTLGLGPKMIAHMLVTPKYRVVLPKLGALMLNAAKGGTGGAATKEGEDYLRKVQGMLEGDGVTE